VYIISPFFVYLLDMGKVAIITNSQKDSLIGRKYDGITYYNPVLDINNNWVISEEEIVNNTTSDKDWLVLLPLIEYESPNVDINGPEGSYLGN